jgi:hypothetical protein
VARVEQIRFFVCVSRAFRDFVNEESKLKADDFLGFVHSKSIGDSAERCYSIRTNSQINKREREEKYVGGHHREISETDTVSRSCPAFLFNGFQADNKSWRVRSFVSFLFGAFLFARHAGGSWSSLTYKP